MLRIRLPCCPRAASGHATAVPPRSNMNARRLMGRAPSSDLRPHITTPLRKNAAVHHSKNCALMSQMGLVSRASPVQTAVRNCTRDQGRSFEVGNQVLISSHRKPLSSKAMVANVAEKSEQDFDRHD